MGILKHFVLPTFCTFHGVVVTIGLTQGKLALAKALGFPLGETGGLSPLEGHFLGSYLGLSTALIFNDLAAILTENSHYRLMATAVEVIGFATDATDAAFFAGPGFGYVPLCFLSVLGLVGMAVHSREPGIFTKDKNNTKDD